MLDIGCIGPQALDQFQVVPVLWCFVQVPIASHFIAEQRGGISKRVGGVRQLPLLAIGSTFDNMDVIILLQIATLLVLI